ncbi:M13 family metallopeptidase [Paraferrimonas haliotis]|uniref:Peptidase M13 n=1 Tax=Paraferrimonas haliotis TaxID=2013866 RepID=A0AA37TU59_9GAMM|nr:M13-type metalloendopeptidase [Paraferrimonas haliotis]GLS82989.1 peptidase M13 [Paraferrimonas haliotis]
MNYKWLLIGCSLALASCHQTSTNTDTAQSLTSGLRLQNMDISIKPGDDFNAYVNGAWIEKTEIPADKSSYGSFTLLHDQAQADVKAIIEEAASGNAVQGSDEQKVGALYASYVDQAGRDKLGLKPIQDALARIDALPNNQALARYFAKVNKIGVDVPLQLGQYTDFKDPNIYMMYTWQGGLGLPDREYYFNEDETSVEVRAAYLDHLKSILSIIGVSDARASAEKVFALEKQLAGEHMKKEKTRDMVALYNRMTLSQLSEAMPNFDWNGYLEEAGIAGIEYLVVPQVDYSKALDKIITDVPLSTWKDYLKWRYVAAHRNYLTSEIYKETFDFYGKTLWGVEQPQTQWRRGVDIVNQHLGEVVGKVYVKKHFPPQAKARMEVLVANLIKAYELSIKDLDWMGEDTRAQALDKLSKFTPKIGYPDKWRDYSNVEMASDTLVANIHSAKLADYQRQIERRNDKVDKSEWAMTPQTVNAYYNPPLNEIVFPAAILQPPFFDLNADDAVNYGGIGAVIGHEIGHGFDDAGSTFDGDGVLRDWWTKTDRAEFKNRTAMLIEQYNGFYLFDDLHVNGEFTLGENIGDLGGLSITLKAYLLSLKGQSAPVMDGFTGIQRVFLGYGQVWANKSREEYLRNLVASDPHSPPQYRVNGIVRNVPEFYQAFNVTESQKLYLSPEQRVKIW